jgi:hypothetical protein
MKTATENNPPVGHEAIANLARQIWEQEGRQPGQDLANWLRAERQLLAGSHRQSNFPANPPPTVTASSLRPRKAGRGPASTTKFIRA